jgi:TonB family protein
VKRILLASSLLFLLAAGRAAWADDVEADLNKEYVGKVLTLRHFYEGDHLRFLSDGNLVGNAVDGPWTIDGRVEIKQIHLKSGLIEIKARRINIVFDVKDPSGKVPTPVDQLATLQAQYGKKAKKVEKDLRKLEVTIEIDFPDGEPKERDIDSAIFNIFFMPRESMIEAVPSYWRGYFAGLEGRPATVSNSREPAFRVGGAVSAPHAISSPDPEYSEEARKAKYQGTALLWLVVDSSGKTRDLQIVRPLGLGLDEKAIEKISTWRFDPATKNGAPVAVQINVEVSFKLY